jgi:hypothetical protein
LLPQQAAPFPIVNAQVWFAPNAIGESIESLTGRFGCVGELLRLFAAVDFAVGVAVGVTPFAGLQEACNKPSHTARIRGEPDSASGHIHSRCGPNRPEWADCNRNQTEAVVKKRLNPA